MGNSGGRRVGLAAPLEFGFYLGLALEGIGMELGRRWYAASVRGGCGQLAVQHLQRQKFEAFCPVVAERRLERGREIIRKLQLFPGYVFVAFDIDVDRWISVNGTVGVGRLLGQSSDILPSPLPKGFVEDLQGLQQSGGLTAIRAELLVYQYRPKEKVRVRSGPFEGHIGEFVRYRKGAIVLLMTLLGTENGLGFHPHEVVPVSPIAA